MNKTFDEVPVDRRELFPCRGIHQKLGDVGGEIVAGRPINRPVAPQLFVIRKNFFDDQIETERRLSRITTDKLRVTALQGGKVLFGIPQTIHMVDSQSQLRSPLPVTQI